jgi:hypothetical protein
MVWESGTDQTSQPETPAWRTNLILHPSPGFPKEAAPMKTQSQRALLQMTAVLALAVATAVVVALVKMDVVRAVFLSDWRSITLNGVIVLLFTLGIGRLYQGFLHYAREERQVARFVRLKDEGQASEAVFTERHAETIIARRYATIRKLFDRGVPINHSAISAITLAEESLYQSFPRFVNSVLILTGVFGTVTSLIVALVGASDIMQAALPGEGMGMMLRGMNTALTTTATAIVCFFFFNYFYQKLTDAQTYLFSQVERAVLLHMIPEFTFEPEAINHQTKHLIQGLERLVQELQQGVSDIGRAMTDLNAHNEIQLGKWERALAGQEHQQAKFEEILSRLDEMRSVLVEGFRLRR